MRIFYIVSIAILLLHFSAIAQDFKYCGTSQKEKELQVNNPSILICQAQLEQFVQEWIATHQSETREETVYIIPLVFHIIHDYGTENISDDQIVDAVRILNLDYRKKNADTSAIIDQFKSIATDAKVEFRLANKAPDGSCTNGIEHIHSLHTYAGDDNAKLNDWPRADYLNVWTVKYLFDDVAGYAYLPADVNGSTDAPNDGVIILSDYVGSIGTGNSVVCRSLTHEIGHFLGLLHPWGTSNTPGIECDDDNIQDTPITAGWTSCNLSGSVCTPGVIENVQNYMEYSYCSNMFTTDQGLEMQAILSNSTAQRNNLSTSANLLHTGTDDTTRTLCAPVADFYAAAKMVCAGSNISFHDISSNGTVTNRTWTFPGGTPSTSTEKDPEVSFSSQGWKSITLNVSNSQGSNNLTQTNYIYVSDDAAEHSPGFLEAFEDASDFSNDWIVFNPEGNSSKFDRFTSAGYNSASSVKLNNYHNMNGDRDQLISPSYDLSGSGTLFLNFRYSCASNSNVADNINDNLTIYSSTNCGQTWSIRFSITNNTLANAGYVSSSFTPNSEAQWVGKSVLLPSSLYQPNVRFKFEYKTNGYGNNFYIDDINVNYYPVGIDDPDASSFSMNIFPNPAMENSILVLNQEKAASVSLKIIDMQGRIIEVLNNGWLSEGEHHFDLNASKLQAGGMYLLVADDGVTIQQTKFIVQ